MADSDPVCGSDQSLVDRKEGPSPVTSTKVSDIQPRPGQFEASSSMTGSAPVQENMSGQFEASPMTGSELVLHTALVQETMSDQSGVLIIGSKSCPWPSPASETQHVETVMSRLQMNIQTLMKDKKILEEQLEEKQTEIDKLKATHEVEKQISKNHDSL